MKLVFSSIFLSTIILTSCAVWGKAKKDKDRYVVDPAREQVIGSILKSALESYHYRNLSIDNSVSEKAFSEYVKKLDYGKQFFLQSDVDKLAKYKKDLDDHMVTGEHKLIKMATDILKQRIAEADAARLEIFKKPFDFTKAEKLEVDPDKRGFPKDKAAFKENWRKLYKHFSLNRYLALKEAQNEKPGKDKKKKKNKKSKKKKKEKKLTDKELRKKAQDAIKKKYGDVFKRIRKEDRFDQLEKFYNSIAGIFDPHTSYLPPKKKEDFDIDISGQLEGIGAVLQEDGPHIKVVRIVPGGAAWREKGLEVDDIIMMVAQEKNPGDPVDLVDMRVDDAVRYIRGKKGTVVHLHVKKGDGSRKVIKIERDVVQIKASYAKSSILQHKSIKKKIGYIRVPKFYRDFDNGKRNCTEDVRMELGRLKNQKVDGVILDLRNNGGGALEDARQMSGLFIKKGPIVQIKGFRGDVEVLADKDETVTYDGPLIVMINRFSASASEILAGAMQDYKRAIIVGGEFTHGKGTVQAVVNLNNGPLKLFGKPMGALKVTIQKFYRVSGESTQYKGITPDIVLPDPYGYTKSREQDLDFSLPWDAVAAKEYDTWSQYSYDLPILKKRSEKRVGKSTLFNKIKDSVKYFVERREDTEVSLNLKDVLAEDKKNKKMTEKFKLDIENKKILVSHFEESIKAHQNITKGDEKQWKEDFKQQKEDWVKELRKDPMLEETLYIINDMIHGVQGKKLSSL